MDRWASYGFRKSLQLQSNKQSWDQQIHWVGKNSAHKVLNIINKNFAYIFPWNDTLFIIISILDFGSRRSASSLTGLAGGRVRPCY